MLTLSFSITKPAQAEFSTTPAIAVGGQYSLVLKSDGSVWSWGYNADGELGDGTTTNRSTPVQMQNLTGVTAIAAGGNYSMILKSDGTVWTWGGNSYGQLGDGTSGSGTSKSIPVQAQNLTGVTTISSGNGHSLVLKSDGTVWAWGRNYNHQLGIGDSTSGPGEDKSTPIQVKNLAGVTAIAGGGIHSIALKSDGTLWTWGGNTYGQLGDGTTKDKSTPVQVKNLTNVIAIAAGYNYCLALKSNGTVWAWGRNYNGELGDGTGGYGVKKSAPVQVQNITDVIAIAAGYDYSFALKSDGTAWAWGGNMTGVLGDGTTESRLTPVQVQNITDAVAIAGRSSHSLALKSDGTVWAWGWGDDGQLGDGTTERRTIPVQVLGPDDGGFLNLLQSTPSITLNITSPEANTAYSEIAGHNTITVAGTVMEINNNNVTVTAELKNTSGVMVKEESVTVEQCQTAKEFSIEFAVADIPEGKYSLEIKAVKS